MSNTPSLLSCPFCGGAATAKPIDYVPGWYHVTVIHSGCLCTPAMDQMVLNDEGLEAWNRRTSQPVNLGFTIENRAGIDVLVWEAGGCQPATSAEVAMWKALSAVQQPVVREPQCWCLTCKPMRIDDPSSIRMALCPTCGNKRCPKANDHRNQCSNSNEPGQKGSAYEGCGITQKGGSNAE